MIKKRGFCAVGLDNPKTEYNVGGVLRAATCYEAALVAIRGRRYARCATDTTAAYRHIPLLHTDDLRKMIPYDCVPVAVDLVDGAENLVNFTHPERAFYIFGSEDGTLGEHVLSWCPRRIMVPTKTCMNLAACVNVVLYDRMAKRSR